MTDERELKAWYDEKHRSSGTETWRPYEAYPRMLDYLDVQPGKKLLDVGCGTGNLLKAAEDRGVKTFGIDISQEAVKIVRSVVGDSEVVVARGEKIPFDERYFDYVVCLGALEHFLDMRKGLQEMLRVGKGGARYCIMVPNADFLYWKISSKKGTEQQQINEQLLSLAGWRNLFEEHGFEVVALHKDQWRMKKDALFTSLNPIYELKKMMYKAAWFCLPLRYTYQFVFVLEKN